MPEVEPSKPYQKHSEESKQAAEAMTPERASAWRDRIILMLQRRAEHGATDYEIEQELQHTGSCLRPRRGELEKMGVVVARGDKRTTTPGHKGQVWILKGFEQ